MLTLNMKFQNIRANRRLVSFQREKIRSLTKDQKSKIH